MEIVLGFCNGYRDQETMTDFHDKSYGHLDITRADRYCLCCRIHCTWNSVLHFCGAGCCGRKIDSPGNNNQVNGGSNICDLGNVDQSICDHVQKSVGQIMETSSEVALVVPVLCGRRITSPCTTDSRDETFYRTRSHWVNRDARHVCRTSDDRRLKRLLSSG